MSDFNTLIKQRRVELGLTQLDIAQATGVTEATVSRWESGQISNMRRSKIAALAKVLRLPPSTLMGIDDSDFGEKETPAPISEGERPDPTIARIIEIVRQLSPETQRRCLEYFESLLALQNAAQAPNTPD